MNGPTTVTATFELHVNGESRPVEASVALPVQSRDGLWSCRVSITGAEPFAPIMAEDGLQAMSLGLDFVRRMLDSLAQRGTLTYPGTSEPVDLESYFPSRP